MGSIEAKSLSIKIGTIIAVVFTIITLTSQAVFSYYSQNGKIEDHEKRLATIEATIGSFTTSMKNLNDSSILMGSKLENLTAAITSLNDDIRDIRTQVK